jgi:hypothetical protein
VNSGDRSKSEIGLESSSDTFNAKKIVPVGSNLDFGYMFL